MRWQLLKAFVFSTMPGVKSRPEIFLGMKHASEHVRILFHEDFSEVMRLPEGKSKGFGKR